MTAFRRAFTRKATKESDKFTRSKAHWRHTENSWDVVSTVLCDSWDNATHPEEHDAFNTKQIGMNDGITRYVPENPVEWEMFFTEETHVPMILDKEAHRQFESAFRNEIDYLNVEEVVEFLSDTFEVSYSFNTPKRDTCSNCNGAGRYCDEESCNAKSMDTYCRVDDHYVECKECDGRGEFVKRGFTRTFPYTRDTILSEKPSRQERQILQFTLNRMANIAEENDTTVSFRKVMWLFHTYENSDAESLISTAVSYIEDSFETVQKPARDEDGNMMVDEDGQPMMVEQPDPDEIAKVEEKFSALLGMNGDASTAATA